jgi:hypothetical protein
MFKTGALKTGDGLHSIKNNALAMLTSAELDAVPAE